MPSCPHCNTPLTGKGLQVSCGSCGLQVSLPSACGARLWFIVCLLSLLLILLSYYCSHLLQQRTSVEQTLRQSETTVLGLRQQKQSLERQIELLRNAQPAPV